MDDEKYTLTLEGSQIDDALEQLNQRVAEGWAVGTRDGAAVPVGSIYHENNAKYYAEQAGAQKTAAEAAAARAEAAVPAGTEGAVFFTVDQSDIMTEAQKAVARNNIDAASASDSSVVKATPQTFTTAQQEQARANIMAGGSNRNLLDNWYFVGGGSQLGNGVFPINQRGATSYSGTYWGLDRWHVEGTSVITLAADGLQFYSTSSSDAAIFTQTLTTPVFGETVTCSAIINGTLAQVTYNVPQSGPFDLPATVVNGVYINLYCPLGTWVQFRIYTSNTSPCVIKSAKVEFGTVSTLANDAPPDFVLEQMKCYRYLYIMGGGAPYTIFGIGVAETTSYMMAAILLPVPMRAAPTVSVIGTFRLWGGVGYDFVCDGITQSSATQMPLNCPYVGVACSTSSNGLTIGKFYDLQSNNNINTKLIFAAEL